jgi:uncharacterized protein YyaL (SSP411 family)
MKTSADKILSVVLAFLLSSCWDGAEKTIDTRPDGSPYLTKAQETNGFVKSRLLTPSGSYRANTTTHQNNAWQWYQVSQILADAAMVQAGDAGYEASMNRTYAWMENMWDRTSAAGGYFAAANLDGSGAGGDKYVDDNALAGVVYLECYNVTTGAQQTQYLNSAKAAANWLMFSGMWDDKFGGGFWWNTTRPVKPTQSNGLAMQLFIRLYGLTGQKFYLDWANSVRNWLETQMYDPADGLLVWQIEADGTKRYEKFAYDNAIMIEAYLDYFKVTGEAAHRTKAVELAAKLNAKLWDGTKGVYKFNSADPRVNPAWCGWVSQAMIRLYETDKNPAWLDYAQKNIGFMNAHNRDAASGGYRTFANLDGTLSDGRYEGVDQAWMQRIQALLAKYR